MLEVQLENGERIWMSVFAVRSVKNGTAPDTTQVTWTDGSSATIRSEASALARRIRIEMAGPGRA